MSKKQIIIIAIVVFVILSLLCACCGTFLLLSSNSSESDLSSTTDTDEDITTPTAAETQITPTTLANDDRQELSEDDVVRHNLKRLSESGGIDLDKEILRILEERNLDEKFDIFRDSKTPTPTQKPTFNPTTEPTLTPTQAANNSQYSKIQAFVNPSAPEVRRIASGASPEQLFAASKNWVWVEDKMLTGENELWIYPQDFLTKTPDLKTNPVPGRIASDCEEHAYTLTSALLASGMKTEHVRVALGKVDFGGSIGGHAWVQVYDESSQRWFDLEPSSGDAVDPKTGKYIESDGVPYDFFKTRKYPVHEYYLFFNNSYYYDPKNSEDNAPAMWK
ncbi:MAG: hypothetical protein ACOCXT_00810 [Candidatus Dojkabacteria bacterium]